MYKIVRVGDKLYEVFATRYRTAIAQAVGQAVADGQEVNKQTKIELVLVD